MSAADDAFRAAQAKIAEVKAAGRAELDFSEEPFRALERVPDEIAGLTGLTALWLTNTQVSDLAPLAGMTGLTTLMLSNTRVSDLAPLAGMTGMRRLSLDGTQVSDLAPLVGMTGMLRLWLDRTQVSDLRPILGMTKLVQAPTGLGLQFEGCAAAKNDPQIAEIAGIKDAGERARVLFAYLDELVADPDLEAALAQEPVVPQRRPAPLEVTVTDTSISMAGSEGLPGSDANARAGMGWEALRSYRQDFAGAFNISNYAPLPAYLASFDREMGEAYDPRRVVAIGVQGQRIVALSADAEFVAKLPDGAATDLKQFAAAIATYVNRFPDWVDYRDDADPDDVSPTAVRAVAIDLKAISAVLMDTPQAQEDVRTEYRAEVSEGTDANAQAPEARGVMASTREIARALAERGLEDQRKQQMRNRKLARHGGELVDGVALGPLGLPLHVMKRLEEPLRALAMRFPNGMGWVGSVYDHVFGPEDQR